jgi:hypothetical protein
LEAGGGINKTGDWTQKACIVARDHAGEFALTRLPCASPPRTGIIGYLLAAN